MTEAVITIRTSLHPVGDAQPEFIIVTPERYKPLEPSDTHEFRAPGIGSLAVTPFHSMVPDGSGRHLAVVTVRSTKHFESSNAAMIDGYRVDGESRDVEQFVPPLRSVFGDPGTTSELEQELRVAPGQIQSVTLHDNTVTVDHSPDLFMRLRWMVNQLLQRSR